MRTLFKSLTFVRCICQNGRPAVKDQMIRGKDKSFEMEKIRHQKISIIDPKTFLKALFSFTS